MAVDRRVVVGTFDSENEAATEIERLQDQGYPKDKITLYTSADRAGSLRDSQNIDVDVDTESTVERSQDEEDNRGLWQQIKDAFSTETYDYDNASKDPNYTRDDDVLYPYRADIADGKIVIVVEDYREDTDTNEGTATGTNHAAEPHTNRTETTVRDSDDDLTEDEKIRLKEERLEVDKEEVQTGEVNVRKETKHETKSVDVPVEKEEVVIEKKPVAGEDSETTDTDFDEDSESFSIPVKEEKVEVNKKPVVKEEVEIRKERKEDVEEVTEDVKREEIDVDSEGRTGMEGTGKDLGDIDEDNRRNNR